MRASGHRVLQLEGGEPFIATPDFVKEAMKAALDANQTRYAPSSGIPQLLDALRAKLAREERRRGHDERHHRHLRRRARPLLRVPGEREPGRRGDVLRAVLDADPGPGAASPAAVAVRVPWDDVRGRGDIRDGAGVALHAARARHLRQHARESDRRRAHARAAHRASPTSRRRTTSPSSPTRRTRTCSTTASTSRSRRCRACASGRSPSTRSRRASR